ncbi:MAG: hypothetical protein ABTQ31_00280 [Rhizobiaceae bacterium]
MSAEDFMPGDEAIARIKADLERYEAERARAHAAVRWRVPLSLGALVVATAALAWVFNGVADPYEQWASAPHVFLYVIAFFGLLVTYRWARKPARDTQASFRARILPIVFGFVRDMRHRQNETPESFRRLPRETVGAFDGQSFDDVISGRYEDFSFELYEAVLWQKGGKSNTRVFKGVIVAFDNAVPFPGVLVASHKSGAMSRFFEGIFGQKMRQLQSGIAAIDDAYDFRTNAPEAAQPLVAGRLAQALAWLREAWPEQPARVALHDSDGFLVIPTSKNFFELPPIGETLDYRTHVAPMIADMAALLATASLVRKVSGEGAAQP